jgi:outer membrane protein insertion porin family
LFTFGNGSSKNLAYTVGLSKQQRVNPIFPTYGSEFSISAKLTPPYSLFNGIDYKTLGDQEENKKNTVDRGNQVDANGNIVGIGDYIDASGTKYLLSDAAADPAKVDETI